MCTHRLNQHGKTREKKRQRPFIDFMHKLTKRMKKKEHQTKFLHFHEKEKTNDENVFENKKDLISLISKKLTRQKIK